MAPCTGRLARTLSYIHSKNWLHNDIKQNNILFHFSQGKRDIVLIDFGKSSRLVDSKIPRKPRIPKSISGLLLKQVMSIHCFCGLLHRSFEANGL